MLLSYMKKYVFIIYQKPEAEYPLLRGVGMGHPLLGGVGVGERCETEFVRCHDRKVLHFESATE